LFLGTAKENAEDRDRKGRGGGHKTRGSKKPNAKLTESQVIEMRKSHKEGVGSRKLSEIYRVNDRYVRQILNYESWAWLK